MFENVQKKKFQSSQHWFKRNDSVILLESKQDQKYNQMLNNIYTQNIGGFIEKHKNCLEDIQAVNKTIKQNYQEKIVIQQMHQIINTNQFKIYKEILHRNENIKKSLSNYANTFPLSPLPSFFCRDRQNTQINNETKYKPQLNKTRTNKQILIIDKSFKRQHYDKQIKYNRINHIDKIYSSITSAIFSKNQIIYTDQSKKYSFMSEKDKFTIVPNRIKMAKIASKIKKNDCFRRNPQYEDDIIRKQKTNKVSLSLGDQIMTKFRMSKNDLKTQFSPISTKRCLYEITKLKQKMEMNKSKQMQVYNSISKPNIPWSVSIAQHQGYRPKNRYFETIIQLNRQNY